MHWLWWLQIAADVVLIAAVFILLTRLRGLGELPKVASPADLERFISEAQKLSAEFDRLLGEKRELVATTLSTLDGRIRQLKQMAAGLDASGPKAAGPAKAAPAPAGDQSLARFRRQVLELSGQGKSPADIAEATGKSRGEVELVLGLSGKA